MTEQERQRHAQLRGRSDLTAYEAANLQVLEDKADLEALQKLRDKGDPLTPDLWKRLSILESGGCDAGKRDLYVAESGTNPAADAAK